MAYIDETWTDMRPASLRRWMRDHEQGRRRLTRLPTEADGLPAPRIAVAQSEWPGWGPVLPAQHGMILNYMRFPDDGVDVIQVTLDWTGPLEREPFEAAWRGAARQHPVLRTAFRLDDRDGLVQVVDPEASIDIRWRDLPQPPASGPDHPFESFLRADRRERLNLTRGPLVRLTILRRVRARPTKAAALSLRTARS